MGFLCLPILPGSAEAQIIWGGTVKRLLTAYFIGTISAKRHEKCVQVCQSYSKAKVERFLRHSVLVYCCLMITEYPYNHFGSMPVLEHLN